MVVLYWSWLRIVIMRSSPGSRVRLRELRGPRSSPCRRRRGNVARARARSAARSRAWSRMRALIVVEARRSRARSRRGCGRSRRLSSQPGTRERAPSARARRGPRRWPPRSAAARQAGASAPRELVHDAHRVLDGDELRPARLHGRARCGRGTAGCSARAARDEVRAVQLGGDVRGQVAAPRSARRCSAVSRRGREEVAAQGDRTRARARRASPAMAVDGVEPCARRRRTRALRRARSRSSVGRLLPDAHGPVALHVAVPAHRAQAPAPGRADVAAQEQAELTISCTLATPFLCCVRPMAQQAIMRSARGADLGRALGSASRGHAALRRRCRPRRGRARPRRTPRSRWCGASMNARSSTLPGRPRSSSSIALMMPCSSATSPLMRTWQEERREPARRGRPCRPSFCGWLEAHRGRPRAAG